MTSIPFQGDVFIGCWKLQEALKCKDEKFDAGEWSDSTFTRLILNIALVCHLVGGPVEIIVVCQMRVAVPTVNCTKIAVELRSQIGTS